MGQQNDDALEGQMAVEEIADSLRSPLLSHRGYAEFALESYKKERGSDVRIHIDYKIVQTVGCRRVLQIVPGYKGLGPLDCCHVSFFVRSSKPGSNKVLFFAELVDFCYGDQFVLNNFSILKLDSPEITYGCGFCPSNKGYPHPRDAYFAGEGDYVPTDDMAQKEMVIRFDQALTKRLKGTRTTSFNFRRSFLFQPEPFENFVLDPSLRSPHLSTLQYAKLFLKYYEELHNTVDAYEIVNALSSCRILSHVPKAHLYEVVDWCHVSFTAKPRNSNCKDDIVLFFAELADFSYGDRLGLNYYSISKLDAPDVTYGCGFCPPNENHPHILGAYFAGLWDNKPTKVSSQKEMSICFQRQVIANRKKKETSNQYQRPKLLPKLVNRDPGCFSPMLSDHEYAEIALSYINIAEAAEYKLVKTMYCNRQRCLLGISGYGHWCHVYFIAKCKKNGKASRVHFFAELNDPGVRKFSLSTCCRMDTRDLGTERGCGICPISEKYPHPSTDFYIAGSWPHSGCWSHDNSLQCNKCIETMKNPERFADP